MASLWKRRSSQDWKIEWQGYLLLYRLASLRWRMNDALHFHLRWMTVGHHQGFWLLLTSSQRPKLQHCSQHKTKRLFSSPKIRETTTALEFRRWDSFWGCILSVCSRVLCLSAQLLPTARALPLLEAIVSSNRTSQTAWCQDACKDTPSYTAVTNRSLIAILKRSSSAFIIPSLDDYNKMLWITVVKPHKHPNIDAGRLGFFSV